MNASDFFSWCDRLRLSAQAKVLVERIRTSQPARLVQSGAGNVSGAYPSRKMGVTIQFESHKNELAAIHLLEHDPDVLEYYDQPESIKLSYLTKEGRPTGCLHTPDFFVLRQHSAGWEECKLEEALPKLSKEKPNRYVRTPEDKWDCPPGREYAEPLGLYYRLVSSAEIDWTLQRNLEFLEDYHRGRRVPIPAEIAAAICAAVAAEPGITLAALLRTTRQESSRDNVFALIAEETLYVDLSAAALADDLGVVHIFKDQATAQAISVVTGTAAVKGGAGGSMLPAPINVQVGASFLWDGRAVKILNVGQNRLSLLAENEKIVEVRQAHWEELLRSGKVTAVQPLEDTALAEARDKAAKLIAAASPDELVAANFRYSVLEPYLQTGSPIVEPLPPRCPPVRSLRRWRSSYSEAEKVHGCGFLGLLPARSEQGNRDPKLPESSTTLMTKHVLEKFETITKKTASAVYRELMLACEQKGLVCPSRKTFNRAIKERPKHEQLGNREGERKAYSRQPFYFELHPTTPRHGDRPFEIGHIDHTELDVELVCSRTGRNLGRPWLTLLVDAFSRRILAIYITFDPPSYRSCMMVLRICVLRHGRMPQKIVTDGGKEFASIYFQALLAAYESTRKQRPAAKARFGSICERLFGTTNKQFVQLSRRSTVVHLPRYHAEVQEEIRLFSSTVWDFQRLMPFEEEPNLLEHVEYLYTRSIGCIGVLTVISSALNSMQPDTLTSCRVVNLEAPKLPLRSRLYSLAPIGVGTPYVESLTGYIARLAEAHCVSAGTLLSKELAGRIGANDDLCSPPKVRKPASNLEPLNGLTRVAASWVQTLESVTHRRDLCRLTMLAWAKLLPWKGLLRSHRAWCPQCLGTQAVFYEPLLWNLEAVGVCPIHMRPLLSSCPHCRETLPVLGWQTRPGRCSKCRKFLGDQTAPSAPVRTASTKQLWMAKAVGEMLACQMEDAPPSFDLPRALRLSSHFKGGKATITTVTRRLGENRTTVQKWLAGTRQPQLGRLLAICQMLQVTPLQLLAPSERVEPLTSIMPVVPARRRKTRKRRRKINLEKLRMALEESVQNAGEKPQSASEVRQRLRCSKSFARKYFPELCHAISAAHLNWRTAQGAQRRKMLCEEVKEIAVGMHKAGLEPTCRAVALRLTKPGAIRDPVARFALAEVRHELEV